MSEPKKNYGPTGTATTVQAFRNRNCCLPFDAPGYTPPHPEEVDALIKLAGWSQTEVARLAGVKYDRKKGSPTVRRWKAKKEDSQHREIPYSAWRLLLILAGITDPAEDKRQIVTRE